MSWQQVQFVAVCLAAIILGNSGCTQSSGNRDADTADGLTVAVVPKSTGGEFWETVEQGAREAADALGVGIKWEGTLTETEIAQQNQIIESMINLDVDGMAIAPLNPKATKKSVEAAVDAGIPVVIFDSAVDGDAYVSFVATNNEQGGVLGGEKMIELLGDQGGNVLVLRFIQGTASTEARVKGFRQALEAAGLTIVDDPYCEDGTVAGAKKTASNTLEGHVKDGKLQLDGIFTCNLISALGMAAALDDLRKGGIEVDTKHIGFDTSPKLIEGVQQGAIEALVSQDPKRMGYLAVETLVKHLRGEPIEPIVDTGVEIVTKARLENEPKIRQLVGLE